MNVTKCISNYFGAFIPHPFFRECILRRVHLVSGVRRLTSSESIVREIAFQADGFLASLAIQRGGFIGMSGAGQKILSALVHGFLLLVYGSLERDVPGQAFDALPQLVHQATFRTSQVVAFHEEQFCACLADGVAASGKEERGSVDLETYWTLHCGLSGKKDKIGTGCNIVWC